MIKKRARNVARLKRHLRIRSSLSGTAQKPRLCVFRSNKYIYVQIIDDVAGNTLVAASTKEKIIASNLESTSNVEAAKYLGTEIAKRAIAIGIESIVFDRGGYAYHGKVKALAEAARSAGLKF